VTRKILERVRRTPAGFVRTYGDVSPGAPRAAGAALYECTDPSLPWHRIVRADGSLAKGERHAPAARARGRPVSRRPRRHACGQAARAVIWIQREITLGARGRGFHIVTGEVREAALIFLYRLLFLFYAEDRHLLPVRRPALPRLQRAPPARGSA